MTAREANADLLAEIAALRDRVVSLTRENTDLQGALAQASQREAATSEILQVISGSLADVQPVFDTIARSAATLCEADAGGVFRRLGDRVDRVARAVLSERTVDALTPDPWLQGPVMLGQTSIGQVIMTGRLLNVPDTEDHPDQRLRAAARANGFRSLLTVPMLRDGEAIGAISVTRRTPGSFSDSHSQLLQTFADQAVIAIENVRLFKELEARNRDLTEALEQQTATSEILKVISSSPTHVQPVFDAIAASSVRLCDATNGAVFTFDGELIDVAAIVAADGEAAEYLRSRYPQPFEGGSGVVSRAIRDRAVLNIPDIFEHPLATLRTREIAGRFGYRSQLVVPMLKEGAPIGALSLTRRDPGGFTKNQVALLQTFADQAVIAIENVRLFTELQEKNRALTQAHAQVTEALEQQTATADILRVISSSPTDLAPVFDPLLDSAVRLCSATHASLYRLEGDVLHHVAARGAIHGPRAVGMRGPIPHGTAPGRAILTGETVQVMDAQEEVAGMPPDAREYVLREGVRTVLAVPLLREGAPIGVIVVRRTEVRPFAESEIRLLGTFADQAVVAIENVRLFRELQERNGELTEALDRQTATAGILRVISSSPTDVQPVFDAILRDAVRLCGGVYGMLWRYDGEMVHLGGVHNFIASEFDEVRSRFPRPINETDDVHYAVRSGRVVDIPDVEHASHMRLLPLEAWRRRGVRSVVVVPMRRDDEIIGAIGVSHREVGAFSRSRLELLETFADQAVIAIENVRLFTELQASNRDLTTALDKQTATSDILRVISQSQADVEPVFDAMLSRAVRLIGAYAGALTLVVGDHIELAAYKSSDNGGEATLRSAFPLSIQQPQASHAKAVRDRAAINIREAQTDPEVSDLGHSIAQAVGYQSMVVVPLLHREVAVGTISALRREPGGFVDDEIALLRTFADQAVIAIENARLLTELQARTAELEAASQHKSEFLANMSHELRTPLNAVIGFSEVLSERMFGELNEKQDEYLKDIHASGQHLLSLINDILDLSKIEAGRMELELTDFDLPMTIDNAMTLIRERAARRSIALHTTVDERLGQIQADERKIRQVLLNLLSNAIKFTPEGGRIEVGAKPVNGSIEMSVTDTGVGIAPEDQEAVFEEFRQVGTADKKVEGTGLGLALSRKFIELHGGKISVKSQVGTGSTFTFTVPVRQDQ